MIRGICAVIAAALFGGLIYLWTPSPRQFDADAARAKAESYSARIIRDRFGVPHIYGTRNADVAFGLAYAHAEDDWTTIAEVLAFSRGEMGRVSGRDGAVTDYLVAALGVERAISEKYDSDISEETKEILEGFADGLNFWCAEEKSRCAKGTAPILPQDVVAGFVSRTPFFYGLDEELTRLFEAGSATHEAALRQRHALLHLTPEAELGSNALAVGPTRSADNHTRLLVNSHQPFTGPVAWYEARLKSEDGWDMVGALFPGAPLILHGTSPDLGWAFTVNKPDLVDVFVLETDKKKNPAKYKVDGEWRAFETSKAKFRVKLFGPFSLPVTRPVRRSIFGPVFETPGGIFAVSFAGDSDIRAVEQWRQLNFAKSFDEWRQAMELQGIPSFNVVYADRSGNIGYYYNAAIPERSADVNWAIATPGRQSNLAWGPVRGFNAIPKVENPTSGYVGNANNSPFETTTEGENPDPMAFPPEFGIDLRRTNRGSRLLELYGEDTSITDEEFITYKMDDRYAADSRLVRLVDQLVTMPGVADVEKYADAVRVLSAWDRSAAAESRGAALAILTGQGTLGYTLGGTGPGLDFPDPVDALDNAMEKLQSGFGRLNPEWGEVSRLIRGQINQPVDGGPDTLRAIYGLGDVSQEPLTASFGDSYIMAVDWAPDGTQTIRTIHQFGAATLDEKSPHYADQATLFVNKEWKQPPMSMEALLEEATTDKTIGGIGSAN
ncbi:MAG: penicillin acylase family protein [Pseudomonadota bacterium]